MFHKVASIEPIMEFIQKTQSFTLSNGSSQNTIPSLEVKLVAYYRVILIFMFNRACTAFVALTRNFMPSKY
jgi:hypothetical protein